jgi:O-antigen polymerase
MTISPFLKIVTGGLCAMLLLIPSITFSAIWDPTITSKFLLFCWGITLLIPILAFYLLFVSNKELIVCHADLALILLILFVFSTRLLSRGTFGFSIRLMELSGLGLFYFIVRWLNAHHQMMLILVAMVAGANLQLLLGFLQLLGFFNSFNEYSQVTGSFFNSGPYGGYLASVVPVSIYLLKEKNNLRTGSAFGKVTTQSFNIIYYIISFNVLATLALMPSIRSRACLLSVILSSMFIYRKKLFFVFNKIFTRTFAKATGAIIFFVAMFGILALLITTKHDSTQGRSLILRVTSGIVKENPVFGVGYDRFKTTYMLKQADYFLKHPGEPQMDKADDVYYAFNEPLQFLAENGIAGCLVCFLFILLVFKNKSSSPLFSIALSGLISIAVFSLFSYPSQILPIKVNLFLFLALIGKPEQKMIFSIKKTGWLGNKIIKLSLFTCICLSAVWCFISITRIRNSLGLWKTAYLEYANNNLPESTKAYQAAYPILNANGEFLINEAKAHYFKGDYKSAIALFIRAKNDISNTVLENGLGDAFAASGKNNEAETAYLHAIAMTSARIYSRYLLTKLYIKTNQFAKAELMARTILSTKIKIPSNATNAIRVEMNYFLKDSLQKKRR